MSPHPEDPIDISAPLRQILNALGLPYEDTREIRITPTHLSATVYERNTDGKYHTIPTPSGPKAATKRHKLAIRT